MNISCVSSKSEVDRKEVDDTPPCLSFSFSYISTRVSYLSFESKLSLFFLSCCYIEFSFHAAICRERASERLMLENRRQTNEIKWKTFFFCYTIHPHGKYNTNNRECLPRHTMVFFSLF